MGNTDLYSDESILLETKNVKVKSIPFDAVLTTRRLLLVDSKKNVIPQQNIPLATIRKIESGENAIRDPMVTLSIITETGKTRQMILTFSRQAGGDRKRECDDWIALLKERVALVQPKEVVPEPPAPEPAPMPKFDGAPAPQIGTPTPPSGKKRIEIARPMKKIIEKGPVYPQPVETTSLPQGSFCPRCGNRVPQESMFCNRCGTRMPAFAEQPPEPVKEIPAEPEKVLGKIRIQTPAYTPPAAKQYERKARPVEQIIHTIEPLIEDSKPRTEPLPAMPEPVRAPVTQEPEPAQMPEQVPAAQEPVPAPVPEPAPVAEAPAPAPLPETPAATTNPIPGVSFPVLAHTETPGETPAAPAETAQPASTEAAPAAAGAAAGQPAAAGIPEAPEVPKAPAPSRRPKLIAASIIIIIIIALIGGAVIFTKKMPGASAEPTPVPTIAETMIPTTIPTTVPTTLVTTVPVPAVTQPVIPASGVWVHISYAGNYTGTYGTPGRQISVADTGDHFYQVPTVSDPVDASIRKSEGNSNELVIEVFRDGELVKRSATTAPYGTIEFEAIIRTPTPTPTPKPTITITTVATTVAATNATANVTQSKK